MIRARRARIVATLGPSSHAPEQVLELARIGVDVFRLNFSHGAHEDHALAAKAVRQAERKLNRPLGILADLQGPKLRLGTFQDGSVMAHRGARIRLDQAKTPGDERRVGVPHPELFAAMKVDSRLLIDDGKVRMKVVEVAPDHVVAEVVQGGKLSDRKGIALPGAVIPMSAMTDKDHKDLAFALRTGVDWVALSFVQRAADMAELRKLVQGRAAVLAKIEKPSAVAQIEEILDFCDGVMIARGDLGVELEPEEVPVAQKTLLRAARARGVPVIVATQMLESMITSATPTRAEATDVANAAYEGADALMLSAETAAGAYPQEAVAMMSRIIERVERDPRWPELMGAERHDVEDDADALVAAAASAARTSSTACLVAYTATGGTARRLARERALQPVVALTPQIKVARRLALVWGLEPRVAKDPETLEDMTDEAVRVTSELGLTRPAERILILAGTPFGAPGAANLLRFAHAPA